MVAIAHGVRPPQLWKHALYREQPTTRTLPLETSEEETENVERSELVLTRISRRLYFDAQ
jgi:hypothetical protein